MNTERDELADIIASNRNEYADKTAGRILAAGYRKPYMVTTADDLDALPFETVIRDSDDCVLERWGDMEESGWVTVMVRDFIPRRDIKLPATVLYVGGVL